MSARWSAPCDAGPTFYYLPGMTNGIWAPTSPIWNLLSALLGALVGALSIGLVEVVRGRRERERERRDHVRPIYREVMTELGTMGGSLQQAEELMAKGAEKAEVSAKLAPILPAFDRLRLVVARDLSTIGSITVATRLLTCAARGVDYMEAITTSGGSAPEDARDRFTHASSAVATAVRHDLGVPVGRGFRKARSDLLRALPGSRESGILAGVPTPWWSRLAARFRGPVRR